MSTRYRTHALYAVALGRGRWFRVIGEVTSIRLPFAPYWLSRLMFSEYSGKRRPETAAVCARHDVKALFVVFVDASDARGKLLRAKLSEVTHGVIDVSPR